MGPQSFDCGSQPLGPRAVAHEGMLQWGRSLSTAEVLARSSARFRTTDSLQWGRRLSTAEVTLVELGESRFFLLQWGRSLSTAEVHPFRRPTAPEGRFNGAAVFRLRKSY